jgi:chitinase
VTINGGAITTFASSVTSTVIVVPPVTTTQIEVWIIVWENTIGADDATVYLTSSVQAPPIVITQSYTTGSTTRPAAVWTYFPPAYPLPTAGQGPDDPPHPPPPPPPPPFPPSVVITVGTPKPPCAAPKICGPPPCVGCNKGGGVNGGGGNPCPPLVICGCIGPFCTDGPCVGVGCTDTGGGGGGGGGVSGICPLISANC